MKKTSHIILALLLDVAIGVVGLYMIRPAMRERIEEIWQKKWSNSSLAVK